MKTNCADMQEIYFSLLPFDVHVVKTLKKMQSSNVRKNYCINLSLISMNNQFSNQNNELENQSHPLVFTIEPIEWTVVFSQMS